MRLFKHFAALAALLFASSPALADIALPKSPTTQPPRNSEVRRDLPYAQMSIERVEGLREARLQIPRTQLRWMNGMAGEAAGLTGAQSGPLGGAATVVGGLFLSLSAVLTGLLLLRSRRRGLRVGGAAAALLACACAAGLAGVAAYANAGPPPGYRAQDPGTLIRAASAGTLSGSIRIEIVEEGAELKLLIPAKTTRKGGEEE
ncbi:MAG TPA: hypothetical protein VF611_01470 [Pyrinomonadaceae bacterium]|jgi:hypothetical protein